MGEHMMPNIHQHFFENGGLLLSPVPQNFGNFAHSFMSITSRRMKNIYWGRWVKSPLLQRCTHGKSDLCNLACRFEMWVQQFQDFLIYWPGREN